MTRISHFKIGLFFLLSLGVTAGGLFWLGTSFTLRESTLAVTYFDSTVKGLSPSSNVTYLGLNVGKVESLELDRGGRNLVRVVMRLDRDFELKDTMAVQRAIKGVTGQAYLAITQAPANLEAVTPRIDFPLEHPLIPSVPGPLEKMEQALADIYAKVEPLDIQGLVAEWRQAARSVEQTLSLPVIGQTMDSVRSAADDVGRAAERLSEAARPLAEAETGRNLKQALRELAAASSSLRGMAASLERQVGQLQPGAVAELAGSVNSTLGTVDHSVGSLQASVEDSLTHFRQGIDRMNEALAEIEALARSLQSEPGRILNRQRAKDPFQP